ncbi:hypothetical protein HY450_01805 [Candidatus Pacearchaeota archaeon]|nr:hypothetical protein [Candidatus Pacearchaeota archaeon]
MTGTKYLGRWVDQVAVPARNYAFEHPDEIEAAKDKFLVIHPTEGVVKTGSDYSQLYMELPEEYLGKVLIVERSSLLGGKMRRVESRLESRQRGNIK